MQISEDNQILIDSSNINTWLHLPANYNQAAIETHNSQDWQRISALASGVAMVLE